jgi:uncharacterized protein (TIGR02145 family)
MKNLIAGLIPLFLTGILFFSVSSCESEEEEAPPDETIYNPNLTYGSIFDMEGNEYKTIKIGTQTWMAGNLRSTRYNDSTAIKLIIDDNQWADANFAAYCWYGNDKKQWLANGVLYNWYAIDSNKICPMGWHVPSDAEWTKLEIYLQNNNFNYDGKIDTDNDRITNNKIAKALASKSMWVISEYEGSVGATDYPSYRNKSGFSALPGGYRNYDGTFHDHSYASYWWTSSESSEIDIWTRFLAYNYGNLYRTTFLKNVGFSVCCLMDSK